MCRHLLQQVLRRLYDLLLENITSADRKQQGDDAGGRGGFSVIFDDVTQLAVLGCDRREWMSFLHACSALGRHVEVGRKAGGRTLGNTDRLYCPADPLFSGSALRLLDGGAWGRRR